jgi:cobalt-zinc-cadmium efflux system outer membrane protein
VSKVIVSTCVFLLMAHQFAAGQKPPAGHRPALTPPVEVPADLDLAKAEQLLLERNLSIIANRYQLDATQAARLIAGYKPNPYVQIGMEQVAIHSPLPGSYPRFVTTNPDAGANPVYTAQITKTFERGGKREARIEEADQVIQAARAQIDDTLRTQVFALRQAFGSALLARDDLQLAQSLDDNYQRVQDLTETRVRTGALAQIELFRVRSGRLPYAQAILDARNAYEQSVQDILNLLSARPPDAPSISSQVTYNQPGATPGQVTAPAGAGATVPSPQQVTVLRAGPTVNLRGSFTDAPVAQTLAEVRDLALRERPDVVEARKNFLAAEAATKLAQAQRHRDLSVGVEYQRVGDDDSLGIVAQVPLFLYNNQKAGIVQAVAQEHATEVALHQVELQAVTDVQKAYQAYLGARQSLDLYQKGNLDQVQKLVETADFSYQHGATSLFELLDAQRTLRQTQTAYNQARENYQMALWQLEEAVGKPLVQP